MPRSWLQHSSRLLMDFLAFELPLSSTQQQDARRRIGYDHHTLYRPHTYTSTGCSLSLYTSPPAQSPFSQHRLNFDAPRLALHQHTLHPATGIAAHPPHGASHQDLARPPLPLGRLRVGLVPPACPRQAPEARKADRGARQARPAVCAVRLRPVYVLMCCWCIC